MSKTSSLRDQNACQRQADTVLRREVIGWIDANYPATRARVFALIAALMLSGINSYRLSGNWRAEMALDAVRAMKLVGGFPRMTVLRLAARAVESAGMKRIKTRAS